MPNLVQKKNSACAANFIMAFLSSLHEIAQRELIVVFAAGYCLSRAFGGVA